ncbi:MAG: serine/threonine protein kinase [Deltaproteobacteria bacterium]|nr:serine/threonine protein kinase [Deltaproteobacteria bacterium]
MGIVYAARDTVLEREVALKQLRRAPPGGGNERLVREAQAMAQLSHPSVVTVFDAVIVDGSAYIVMERVGGTTLRGWLKQTERSRQQIIDVFLQAARGLAAAHAAGIVHGDFKPDNVLVDPSGRARVVDFGLARVAESAQAHDHRHTFAGTPVYMAPEQLDGRDADAACDQYAFGASLHEALCGKRAYDGATLAERRELQRSRCKVENVPRALARIVERCLSEAAASRFISMDEVARALERTRRRPYVWAAGGVATLVVAGAIVVGIRSTADAPVLCPTSTKATRLWDAAKREPARSAFLATGKPYAQQAWVTTERVLESYAQAWTAASGEACEATYVHHTQSAAVLDLRSECLDTRLAEFGALVDLFGNADAQVVEKAVDASAKLSSLAGCANAAALRDRLAVPEAPAARETLGRVRAELAQAKALDDAGKLAEARTHAATAAGLAREVGYKPIEADALERRGSLEFATGEYKVAEATLREAVLAAQAGRDNESAAQAYTLLIAAQTRQARYDAAQESSRHALALLEGLGVQDAAQLASALSNTGSFLLQQAKWDEGLATLQRAAAMFERASGSSDIRIASTYNNMALAHGLRGDKREAIELAKRAFAIREQALGPDHPDVASSWFTLGSLHSAQGNHAEALTAYQRCLAIQQATLGPEHPLLARTLSNLGHALQAANQVEAGLAALQRALAIREKVLGADHPDVARTLLNLGELYRQQGDHLRAVEMFRRGLAIAEAKLPPKAPEISVCLAGIGLSELAAGEPARALPSLERAVALLQGGMPNELAPTEWGLARALWDTGRDRVRARQLARKALERFVALERATDREQIDAIRSWLARNGG